MDHSTTHTKKPHDKKLAHPGPPHTSAPKKAHEAAGSAALNTENVAAYVGHKAENATAFVGHKAEDAASYVDERTREASAAVGSRLRSLGDSVREHAPEGGIAGNASAAISDTLESGGRYLQEEGLRGMADDVTNLIRRNPILALLIGVAGGFLVARVTTPRG
jgi:hypothetical protein